MQRRQDSRTEREVGECTFPLAQTPTPAATCVPAAGSAQRGVEAEVCRLLLLLPLHRLAAALGQL